MTRRGFKVLTHDYRPPILGGDPIWDGETLPFTLPKVRLDVGPAECAAGWNYTTDLASALQIAGLWPDGHPACCLHVEASDDAITRGEKSRCSQLTIVGLASRAELEAAIRVISEPFGVYAERMAASQLAWYDALARPRHDERRVEVELRAALEARGLDWRLRRYESARVVRDALAVWATWAMRAERVAWAARVARNAWAAWDAQAARGTRAARDARDAWDAWKAWEAWAARDALTLEHAALQGWTDHDPLLLTTGLREAYAHGLGVAVPVGGNTLGWAMAE